VFVRWRYWSPHGGPKWLDGGIKRLNGDDMAIFHDIGVRLPPGYVSCTTLVGRSDAEIKHSAHRSASKAVLRRIESTTQTAEQTRLQDTVLRRQISRYSLVLFIPLSGLQTSLSETHIIASKLRSSADGFWPEPASRQAFSI
jgi:hypothetical protein